MKVDKNYFPGWVRKSFTFTNDDGNIVLDTKFINILKPYGILGTFNLCDAKRAEPQFLRELYRGYGIANHCKRHPFALDPDESYTVSDEEFSPETADEKLLYKKELEGEYYKHIGRGWRTFCTADTYCSLVKLAQEELGEVFGAGAVKSYVWPFTEQKDPRIHKFLKDYGFRSIRRVGALKDTTGFALPADRMAWSYNATDADLLEVAELYESYPDDGELKFFCFGLHSHDYENANTWWKLKELGEKYGNRPESYYYASVDDIFDYEDALGELIINESSVENPTDITLYIKVDGERIVLPPRYKFEK